ncbi:MAG: HAD family phosphatase [Anaerolineae bacterium]|nr:HAD family phosphatase [Anaerolineae bacterium]
MIKVEPHVKALIFDCDGTLADTLPFHYRAWQETMRVYGKEFPQQLFLETGGMHTAQIVTILNERLGYQLDLQKTTREKEANFARQAANVQPIEPVVAVARQYRGRLPIAVASGGIKPAIQTTLQAIGLANFFDAIVTSEDVTHGKPAPDTFLEAARRLRVEPQYCQVFEDSEPGLEAAQRAGMLATDIRPWRHNWV